MNNDMKISNELAEFIKLEYEKCIKEDNYDNKMTQNVLATTIGRLHEEVYREVIRVDGSIIGYVEYLTEEFTMKEGVTIGTIYVMPQHRRRGYGEILLRKAEDAGLKYGYESYFAQVVSLEAARMFEKHGYMSQMDSEDRLWFYKRV